jgi:hypothetical protein
MLTTKRIAHLRWNRTCAIGGGLVLAMYYLLLIVRVEKGDELTLDGENLRNFADKLWEFAPWPRIRSLTFCRAGSCS